MHVGGVGGGSAQPLQRVDQEHHVLLRTVALLEIADASGEIPVDVGGEGADVALERLLDLALERGIALERSLETDRHPFPGLDGELVDLDLSTTQKVDEALPVALAAGIPSQQLGIAEALAEGACQDDQKVRDVQRHREVDVVLDVGQDDQEPRLSQALAEPAQLGALAGPAEARKELDAPAGRPLDAAGEQLYRVVGGQLPNLVEMNVARILRLQWRRMDGLEEVAQKDAVLGFHRVNPIESGPYPPSSRSAGPAPARTPAGCC